MLREGPVGAKGKRAARARVLALLVIASLTGSCTTLGYYAQAINGHFEIRSLTRPIDDWLADPSTTAELRDKLLEARAARAFAVSELGLPDRGSFEQYADLGRRYVLWNVFAAPELALEPKRWCFPVAGCVNYRGYFSEQDAEAFARSLADEGLDVYVGGVSAYSTLGWFRDPLLNTVLRRPPPEVAGLIFHELAHERVYAEGDSEFNESFATVVELEGIRRWLAARNDPAAFTAYRDRHAQREAFTKLVLATRTQLATLYASDMAADEKRSAKRATFEELKTAYARLRKQGTLDERFDTWFAQPLNNAHLAAVGTYHRYVPAFEALLAQQNGDLPAFYREAERLAALPPADRTEQLAALAATR
jgi:predicted aminopeptidase